MAMSFIFIFFRWITLIALMKHCHKKFLRTIGGRSFAASLCFVDETQSCNGVCTSPDGSATAIAIAQGVRQLHLSVQLHLSRGTSVFVWRAHTAKFDKWKREKKRRKKKEKKRKEKKEKRKEKKKRKKKKRKKRKEKKVATAGIEPAASKYMIFGYFGPIVQLCGHVTPDCEELFSTFLDIWKALDLNFRFYYTCGGFTPRFQEIFRKNQKNPKNGCFNYYWILSPPV